MTERIPLDSLTSDQYDALCERLESAEARNIGLRRDIAGCTADRWPERLAEAEVERDHLRTTLDEVLRHFVHKGHPGEPCLSSGWISERTVARWRSTLYPPKEK
ncbi:hypothetical protein [Streptomyces sp. NPDC057910]|uniref:hypothetical protein n=1 Tax=Streptomyces sp. NPDC057910 TaxID=3346278 RepID=UPI0036EEC9D3